MRVPPKLDPFFASLKDIFLWDHFRYFRLLVLSMTFAWGRRTVSNMYRQLDPQQLPHRTRFNNFFNFGRWDPQQALRDKAYELLRALLSRKNKKGKKETVYLLIDDSKKMKRGKHIQAVGWIHDPVSRRSIIGHQYVMATLCVRGYVIPFGVRLYVKKEHCSGLGVDFRKVTQAAAEMIAELDVPAGVRVRVLFDSFYLCPTVLKACRRKNFQFVSTLKSNRNLFKRGRKLKAGIYARNKFRHSSKHTLSITHNHKVSQYRFVDAGWMRVSDLGSLHVVLSRKGKDKNILAIVSNDPILNDAHIIKAYAQRWKIEVFFKDAKQLLGLGQYQNLALKAAVTHLHLVCFAYALLTHIAIMREGEKGNTKLQADRSSTATLQNEFRRIVWDDLTERLKGLKDGNAIIKELTRLLAA